MSALSRLCPASSIAGIGFLIECRAGFSILYQKIHLSVRCFSPLPVAGFLIKSQDITANYFCFLRDTVVRECIWTLVAISYGYKKTLYVLAFESDRKLYRCYKIFIASILNRKHEQNISIITVLVNYSVY